MKQESIPCMVQGTAQSPLGTFSKCQQYSCSCVCYYYYSYYQCFKNIITYSLSRLIHCKSHQCRINCLNSNFQPTQHFRFAYSCFLCRPALLPSIHSCCTVTMIEKMTTKTTTTRTAHNHSHSHSHSSLFKIHHLPLKHVE